LSERRKWLLTYALSVVPLLGFWTYGLFDLDEGFYAAVVAEMNRRSEWITPYYAGHPWFEKPIFLYWLAKPSVLLFGQAIGPRLPSVISTLALFGLCGWYVTRRASPGAGRFCVLALSSSLLLVALGRLMMTDPVLVFFTTAAFLTFYESMVGDQRWRLVTALCLGITVLTKGPVILPLFLVVLIWTLWKEPAFRGHLTKWWVFGTALMLGVVASWYLPAYLANGHAFVQQFLIEQNLQRFTGGDEAHRVPFPWGLIYYPAFLFVGMLPWSIPVAPLWVRSLRDQEYPFKRYLARWAVVILVFFTISGAKLPHYIVPAIPPLVMLFSVAAAEKGPIPWRRAVISVASVFVLLNAGFLAYFYKFSDHADLDNLASKLNSLPTAVGAKPEVITYQFSRQDCKPKHGSINETSHPSLLFYLDVPRSPLMETDNWIQVLAHAHDGWALYVVTRPGRITPVEIGEARKLGLMPALDPELSNQSFETYRFQTFMSD